MKVAIDNRFGGSVEIKPDKIIIMGEKNFIVQIDEIKDKRMKKILIVPDQLRFDIFAFKNREIYIEQADNGNSLIIKRNFRNKCRGYEKVQYLTKEGKWGQKGVFYPLPEDALRIEL